MLPNPQCWGKEGVALDGGIIFDTQSSSPIIWLDPFLQNLHMSQTPVGARRLHEYVYEKSLYYMLSVKPMLMRGNGRKALSNSVTGKAK